MFTSLQARCTVHTRHEPRWSVNSLHVHVQLAKRAERRAEAEKGLVEAQEKGKR